MKRKSRPFLIPAVFLVIALCSCSSIPDQSIPMGDQATSTTEPPMSPSPSISGTDTSGHPTLLYLSKGESAGDQYFLFGVDPSTGITRQLGADVVLPQAGIEFSPDVGRVVFVRTSDDMASPELVSLNVDTLEVVVWPVGIPPSYSQPALSNDGGEIAYSWEQQDGVVAVSAYSFSDGVHRLVSTSAFDPCWSPSADKLVFSRFDTASSSIHLWVWDQLQDTVRDVTPELRVEARAAQWLPNEGGIVFLGVEPNTGTSQLFLLDPDTGRVDQITQQEESIWGFAVSRAGDQIAYVTNPGEGNGLFNVSPAERVSRGIPLPRGIYDIPVWSPDGTRIAIKSISEGTVLVVNAGEADLSPLVVLEDGTASRLIWIR